MRILTTSELATVSGGASANPKNLAIERADPADDVNGAAPGRATGWCLGWGNLKKGETKHGDHLDCSAQ